MGNSRPNVGASSLATDANSELSGGRHFQRTASFNTDSHMRSSASPMAFTSNNVNVSGSSIMDGNSRQEQSSQQGQLTLAHYGGSGATSLPVASIGNFSIPTGSRVSRSFSQDPSSFSMHKKPMLDRNQEDNFQQQVLQRMMQRQESVQLHNQNPQMQALMQQQRFRQQQQLLQSMTPMQRMLLQQQQQQQQQLLMRQQLQQPGTQLSPMKRPLEVGACSRRLMQYLYHQKQRPTDNSISYWRKFVAEYYSPHAKQRWCLSQYDNAGHQSLGVFPQSAMDGWQCEICASKTGRGFEATFDVLPRLNQIKFSSGVIDELLFLDVPREVRYPNGVVILHYESAILESVYEQLRIVRKGQLQVIFTPDLKILSWQFCAHHHEEFFSRKIVAPQANQLAQTAQKFQHAITESGPNGISQQDLRAYGNMIETGGRQLARTMELQSLNDLGFPKRYVRCMQIAEVVNSMKGLMALCDEHKVGPIEGLRSFQGQSTAAKLQMCMDQIGSAQNLQMEGNTVNRSVPTHPRFNDSQMTNNGTITAGGALMMKQNAMNPHQGSSSSSAMHQAAVGESRLGQKGSDLANDLQIPDHLFQDIGDDFGFFDCDDLNEDNVGFGWKD